jgi:hypothetical protein
MWSGELSMSASAIWRKSKNALAGITASYGVYQDQQLLSAIALDFPRRLF